MEHYKSLIMNVVRTEEYKGYTIKIMVDEEATSPRDWDNMGKMICFHNEFKIGDRHNFYSPEEFLYSLLDLNVDLDDISVEAMYDEVCKKHVIIPLYLYDYNGRYISITTTEFIYPWEDGFVGFIYASYEQIREWFADQIIDKNRLDNVIKQLEYEVNTYNKYVKGEVLGFGIEHESKTMFTCWDFYDEVDKVITEAKDQTDYLIKYQSTLVFVHEDIINRAEFDIDEQGVDVYGSLLYWLSSNIKVVVSKNTNGKFDISYPHEYSGITLYFTTDKATEVVEILNMLVKNLVG